MNKFHIWAFQNFPFMEETFKEIDNYHLMMQILHYLREQLKDYRELVKEVEDLEKWFDDLNVQEEIDHKLEEMVESGELQEIISQYLNSTAIFGFDTVEDMKSATNLINGSFARTLGYYSKNDKGGALYKIRTITNEDVVDNGSIIAMNDETLVAELIFENSYLNVMQFGMKEGNDSSNATHNSEVFENAIAYCTNNYEKISNIKFPSGVFCLNSGFEITENISLYGVQSNTQAENVNSIIYKGGTVLKDCSVQNNTDPFITYYKNGSRIWGATIENINFMGVNHPHHTCLNLKSFGWDGKIRNISINQFDGGAINFDDCYDTSIEDVTILGSDATYNDEVHYAIVLDDTINLSDNTNALHFTNCHFEISRHCLKVKKARQNCFTNCKFEFGFNSGDSNAQILIDTSAQDTQFVGCSFVGFSKGMEDQAYMIDIKSTNSLRNTQIVACEFISATGVYRAIKSVGGTIINGCSFQILKGQDYALYFDGRVIFTNNYLRCSDTSVDGGITQVIYCKNANISNNMFEYVGGGTNIANSRMITFEGENTIISNNSNTDIFTQPYYYVGTRNGKTKLERSGIITLDETKLTNLYNVDFSGSDVVIPLDLNDVKGAKIVRFNCSKSIVISDIKNAVGQDNIMIGSANQVIKIKNTSTTAGTRILIPTGSEIDVFGTQECEMHFVDFYWRNGYYSSLN